MIVVGSLGNLKPDQAQQVKAGLTLEGFGEVTAVGKPLPQSTRVASGTNSIEVRDPSAVRLPVAVRMGCAVRSREGHPVCVVGEVDLRPGALLVLPTQFGLLPFQIDQMRSSAEVEPVRATVRFQADPRMLSQMKKGDLDLARATNELAAGATVLEVSAPRPDIREAVIGLQAQRGAAGWTFENQPLRVGGPFQLRTPGYELTGIVVSIDAETVTVSVDEFFVNGLRDAERRLPLLRPIRSHDQQEIETIVRASRLFRVRRSRGRSALARLRQLGGRQCECAAPGSASSPHSKRLLVGLVLVVAALVHVGLVWWHEAPPSWLWLILPALAAALGVLFVMFASAERKAHG